LRHHQQNLQFEEIGAKVEHFLFLLLPFFNRNHFSAVNTHEKVTSNGVTTQGFGRGGAPEANGV